MFWRKDFAAYEDKSFDLFEKCYEPSRAAAYAIVQLIDELACVQQITGQVVNGGGERLHDLKLHLAELFELREGAGVLSSVHKAKGKEAARVLFIVSAADAQPLCGFSSGAAGEGVRAVRGANSDDERVDVCGAQHVFARVLVARDRS